MIKVLEFTCDDLEISSTKNLFQSDSKNSTIVTVKALEVEEEDIMESLNFEDVMNYYGVTKVCEWCEANR